MLENIRRTRLDKGLDLLNTIVLVIFIGIIIYPIYFVLIASFSEPAKIYLDPLRLWPAGFSLASYRGLFENKAVFTGFFNSLQYAFIGTFINIIMTTLAAYPLSRSNFYGKNLFAFLFVFTIFFQGGLIPLYLVNRQLGILDTLWVMVLPQSINVFYMIIMRTYLQSNIPQELVESAKVDGGGEWLILMRIVLPLSMPIVMVLTLFYGVLHWNSYFNGLVFLTSDKKYPLQLILREILVPMNFAELTQVDDRMGDRMALKESMKYASVVISSLPLMLIYPLLSRSFKKGIFIGSLKG